MDRQPVGGFRDLRVWQSAVQLAREVYRLTRLLPPDERFGLSLQLRRAAVSVVSNIAEGHERRPTRLGGNDFRRFLAMARGSVAEIEAQLVLAQELGMIASTELSDVSVLISGTSRMLAALHRRLTP